MRLVATRARLTLHPSRGPQRCKAGPLPGGLLRRSSSAAFTQWAFCGYLPVRGHCREGILGLHLHGAKSLMGRRPNGGAPGLGAGGGQRLPGAGPGVLAGEDWLHEQGP